ncbi:MAG: hypothetical protein ACLFP8_07340 [Alphaproteobacteria bacterium]
MSKIDPNNVYVDLEDAQCGLSGLSFRRNDGEEGVTTRLIFEDTTTRAQYLEDLAVCGVGSVLYSLSLEHPGVLTQPFESGEALTFLEYKTTSPVDIVTALWDEGIINDDGCDDALSGLVDAGVITIYEYNDLTKALISPDDSAFEIITDAPALA